MIVRPMVAAALVAETIALAAAMMLVVDFRAHRASEELGGVNIWGYRGRVAAHKVPGEIRIAVVGGDMAFGWGVAARETLAPNLAFRARVALDRPGQQARRFSGVNLGARRLGPAGYEARLESYPKLQPDIVCIYVDPPGTAGNRSALPRAESAVFAATGYVPMLPLVLIDKGTSAGSAVMVKSGRWLETIDRSAYRRFAAPAAAEAGDPIERTVRAALRTARGVVVIAPPRRGDAEDDAMHQALAAMIRTSFGGERRVRFVDLGGVPELADHRLTLDGVNLSTAGHAAAAAHVVPAVLDLLDTH